MQLHCTTSVAPKAPVQAPRLPGHPQCGLQGFSSAPSVGWPQHYQYRPCCSQHMLPINSFRSDLSQCLLGLSPETLRISPKNNISSLPLPLLVDGHIHRIRPPPVNSIRCRGKKEKGS